MSDDISNTSSGGSSRPTDCVTVTGDPDDIGSSSSSSTPLSSGSAATAAATMAHPRRVNRRVVVARTNAMRWRKYYSQGIRMKRRSAVSTSSGGAGSDADSAGAGTGSLSNNQMQVLASSDSYDTAGMRLGCTPRTDDIVTPDTNMSADSNQEQEESPLEQPQLQPQSDEETNRPETTEPVEASSSAESPLQSDDETSRPKPAEPVEASSSTESPFVNGEQPPLKTSVEPDTPSAKTDLANVIEKAILDFCSSRTVETMRRMFAGVTSEMEALQGEGARQGDKSAVAPHPVTAELVKEGIVIGSMDVFAPRVHREYRLLMRDSLVEGFLTDAGVFRSICFRTKCQLEVTRRLLNRKMCTGGRWVKYLIVRIVGPSVRNITCCDQLLQKAVPAFKQRIEYPKAAFCRLFFREDIPDNTLLYSCNQRTGGTSNRYGALRLETPYRITSDRTVGSCPWKSGALKVGKLSFNGSGGHLSMAQVYPGYGYTYTSSVEPACQGIDAVNRIEHMHNALLTRRQALLQERRLMTIPVCR